MTMHPMMMRSMRFPTTTCSTKMRSSRSVQPW